MKYSKDFKILGKVQNNYINSMEDVESLYKKKNIEKSHDIGESEISNEQTMEAFALLVGFIDEHLEDADDTTKMAVFESMTILFDKLSEMFNKIDIYRNAIKHRNAIKEWQKHSLFPNQVQPLTNIPYSNARRDNK